MENKSGKFLKLALLVSSVPFLVNKDTYCFSIVPPRISSFVARHSWPLYLFQPLLKLPTIILNTFQEYLSPENALLFSLIITNYSHKHYKTLQKHWRVSPFFGRLFKTLSRSCIIFIVYTSTTRSHVTLHSHDFSTKVRWPQAAQFTIWLSPFTSNTKMCENKWKITDRNVKNIVFCNYVYNARLPVLPTSLVS